MKEKAEKCFGRFAKAITDKGFDVEKVYRAFDKDGSGQISTKEFRDTCDKMRLGYSNEDIDLILLNIDHDRSGEISKKEFMESL